MFEKIERNGQLLGHQLKTRQSLCFFGSKNLSYDGLKELFPQFQFRRLKQVHGNKVIEASEIQSEADGHWTSKFEEALVIQTADCVPLLIEGENEVQALHAGWRGVELGILIHALERFSSKQLSGVSIFGGPHISKKNFEVGRDVAQRLLEADPSKDSRSILEHPNLEKAYVDLDRILLNQARALSKNLKIDFLPVDTYEDASYPSYRRDGKEAGRLYSFIVRLNGQS